MKARVAMVLSAGLVFLVILVTATPQVASGQTPGPSAGSSIVTQTPTMDERVAVVERQIDSISERLENPPKDIWDKINSVAGLASGVLIATIGAAATYYYRERQRVTEQAHAQRGLRVSELDIVKGLMPYLASEDPGIVESAMTVIAALDPDLAVRIAGNFRTSPSVSALSKVSESSDRPAAKLARQALTDLEAEALRKLRTIYEKLHGSDYEIAEHLFTSVTYGNSVWPAEVDIMQRKGWIEVKNGKVRITDKGKADLQ